MAYACMHDDEATTHTQVVLPCMSLDWTYVVSIFLLLRSFDWVVRSSSKHDTGTGIIRGAEPPRTPNARTVLLLVVCMQMQNAGHIHVHLCAALHSPLAVFGCNDRTGRDGTIS
jgi:hypothetical protein